MLIFLPHTQVEQIPQYGHLFDIYFIFLIILWAELND